jgi:hypothetical protein
MPWSARVDVSPEQWDGSSRRFPIGRNEGFLWSPRDPGGPKGVPGFSGILSVPGPGQDVRHHFFRRNGEPGRVTPRPTPPVVPADEVTRFPTPAPVPVAS